MRLATLKRNRGSCCSSVVGIRPPADDDNVSVTYGQFEDRGHNPRKRGVDYQSRLQNQIRPADTSPWHAFRYSWNAEAPSNLHFLRRRIVKMELANRPCR